jgi:CRP/FNR family transcriptional regulator
LIDLPLSQQDLADLVGASRQTVSQELHRMARRGLIQVTRHTIILTNMAGLERLANVL